MTPAIDQWLTTFLDEQDAAPFQWGVSDCALFPADWWQSLCGHDPALGWRGTYRTPLGAARLIRRAGGYPALWADALGREGCTDGAPAVGAVGLLRAETPAAFGGFIGGVCLGGGIWASRARDGLLIGRADFYLFWEHK